MNRCNPSLSYFNIGLKSQLHFFWHFNNSIKTDEEYSIYGETKKINIRERLEAIHSNDQRSYRLVSGFKVAEKSLQIINAVPLIGTFSSLLTSVAYLIIRHIDKKQLQTKIDQLFPADKAVSREIFNFVAQTFHQCPKLEEINDDVVKQIGTIILGRAIESPEEISPHEAIKLNKIVQDFLGSNATGDVLHNKKLLVIKLREGLKDIFYQHLKLAWHTNLLARSLMGIVPLYKPAIRIQQCARAKF